MIEATLSVRLGDSWIKDILVKHDVTIKFLGWMPASEKPGGKSLIEIRGKESPDDISSTVQDNPFVCRVQMSKVGKDSILGEIETSRCSICKAMVGTDCFLTNGTTMSDGSLLLTVMSSDRKSIRDFVEKLESDGCDVAVNSIRDPENEGVLTERQEEILRSAYEMGYFEYPKKINIKELSGHLGLSISTLSETLRKSEKKVIEYYLSGK